MRERLVRVTLTFATLLAVSQAAGCGHRSEDSKSGESTESQCLQLHPSQGAHGLPESWPDVVSAEWAEWVEQLGDPISVVKVTASAPDAELAAHHVPSIDATTLSAVCRIEFAADGHFMPEGRVHRGDEADVVLWEKDIRTFGDTSPMHGYAVAVLDPVTGETLAYVERS
jgi:hypothetical protein